MVILSLLYLISAFAEGESQSIPSPGVSGVVSPIASPAPIPSPGPVSSADLKTPLTMQDFAKFRDPFKKPDLSQGIGSKKSALERYATADFKVTGILSGPLRKRAMVQAPDNKTYYVSESMHIGTLDGVVTKITTKSIVVREKIVNALGETEFVDSELTLDEKSEDGNAG